jgi:hypothetical protein
MPTSDPVPLTQGAVISITDTASWTGTADAPVTGTAAVSVADPPDGGSVVFAFYVDLWPVFDSLGAVAFTAVNVVVPVAGTHTLNDDILTYSGRVAVNDGSGSLLDSVDTTPSPIDTTLTVPFGVPPMPAVGEPWTIAGQIEIRSFWQPPERQPSVWGLAQIGGRWRSPRPRPAAVSPPASPRPAARPAPVRRRPRVWGAARIR